MAELQQDKDNDRLAILRREFMTNSGSLGCIGMPGLTIGGALAGNQVEWISERLPELPNSLAHHPQRLDIIAKLAASNQYFIAACEFRNNSLLFPSVPHGLILQGNSGSWQLITSIGVSARQPSEVEASDTNDIVTAAAESLANSLGISEVLQVVLKTVREIMGSSLEALNVDQKNDPEEKDLSTLCFTIKSRASVDETLERDRRLRETLARNISPKASLYLSFVYDFE